MATLAELQAQRAKIQAEIQRRGGAAKAQGFASQLAAIDGQIRTAKTSQPSTPKANTVTGGGAAGGSVTNQPSIPKASTGSAANLPDLQAQRKQILAEIKRRGGKDKAPNFVKQLADVDTQLRAGRKAAGQPEVQPGDEQLPSDSAPTQPEAPPTETSPSPPDFTPPNFSVGANGMVTTGQDQEQLPDRPDTTSPMTKQMDAATQAAIQRMQGGVNSYLPTDPEGSQFYQFQKKQGLGDLEKLMAARGLTKSGAELQANSDFLGKVGAEETERQKNWAMSQYQQDAQTAGNFYGNTLNDYSGTGQRNQNQDQFNANQQYNWYNTFQNQANANRNFQYGMQQDAQASDYNNYRAGMDDLYRFSALGMGQNPMSQAMSGMGDWASTASKQGQTNAQYAANNYARPTAGVGPAPSGGGGGGGNSNGYTPFIPPFPSNVSTIGLNNIQGNLATNTGYGNFFGQLGGFMK